MTRPHAIAEAFCHEVTIYDVFFGKFTLSLSRFVKMITDPRGLVFLALGCVLLFAADPNNVRVNLGPILALLIWIGSVALYVSTIFAMIALFSFTQHHFGPYPIYTPVTSTIGLLLVFICARAAISFITGDPPPDNAAPLFFNLLIAGMMLETLFIRFAMPGIFADENKPRHGPDVIRIGDQQFPVQRIRHMAAQEHYINIAGPTGTVLVRARLRDAVAQTTPEQGLQPHRSWWVSTAAKPKLGHQNGKPVLQLDDDTIVPIAKARMDDVQRWINLHGDW
ncbi:LytTR family DNA-binding domain-containing protein [Yoonia sp. SDW83-1]|uniref:LytTR family DNA-binding domain-containing protein n=1 Tax=Yoonia sp. SDW83-1 TaxID=3366945 RepID=UPI00398C2DC9